MALDWLLRVRIDCRADMTPVVADKPFGQQVALLNSGGPGFGVEQYDVVERHHGPEWDHSRTRVGPRLQGDVEVDREAQVLILRSVICRRYSEA